MPAGLAGSAVAKLALTRLMTATGLGLTGPMAGSSDQKAGKVSRGLHRLLHGTANSGPGALTHSRPLGGQDGPKHTQETEIERESHPPKRQHRRSQQVSTWTTDHHECPPRKI